VILVKKKPSDGSDQCFAIKVLKKSHIVSCCSVTYTVAEKKALVLASGHPFITTLYSCFQTKLVLIFFFKLDNVLIDGDGQRQEEELLNQKFP